MGTWVAFTIRLDPWSYENLLLRQAVLMKNNPSLSRAGALRHILRRLRFTAEQKEAYTEWVYDEMNEKEPEALAEILKEKEET